MWHSSPPVFPNFGAIIFVEYSNSINILVSYVTLAHPISSGFIVSFYSYHGNAL